MSREYPEGWEVLYPQEKIAEATTNLVEKISQINGVVEKPVVLIQILESARVFAEDLRLGLINKGINVRIESISASSYKGKPGEQSNLEVSGLDKIKLSGDEIVFVVDDMVDSGDTMKKTVEQIEVIVSGASVFATVLLQKICSSFTPSFVAIKDCPDLWVAGYGINGNSPSELGEKDGRDLSEIIARVQTSKL